MVPRGVDIPLDLVIDLCNHVIQFANIVIMIQGYLCKINLVEIVIKFIINPVLI